MLQNIKTQENRWSVGFSLRYSVLMASSSLKTSICSNVIFFLMSWVLFIYLMFCGNTLSSNCSNTSQTLAPSDATAQHLTVLSVIWLHF